MKRLFLQIIAGILGLWLADKVLTQVEFAGSWRILILAGVALGLINFFIKPILKIITLPLRILTFGLFGLLINMGMVWSVSLLFPEFKISGILAIFLTSIIIWVLNLFLGLFIP